MNSPRKLVFATLLSISLGGALPIAAQDPGLSGPPPSGGWRRFDPNNRADVAPPAPEYEPPAESQAEPPQPQAPMPGRITIPAGTWIAVRLNEELSSDHNQPGDYFTGTLVQPIVANGRVIA